MCSLWPAVDARAALDGERIATRLRRYMAEQGVPYGLESSAKCQPGRWSSQRWLFSVPCQALTTDRLATSLPALLDDLGMRDDDAATFLAPLNAACQGGALPYYLHLGVEDRRAKVYWETPLTRDAWPTDDQRFVLYRAWKWQAGESASISDYLLLASPRQASEQLGAMLGVMPMALVDLLEQIQVSFALAQSPWPPLVVRTEERGSVGPTLRHSLNLHLHQARLPLGSIAGSLLTLAREWNSATRETLIDYIAAHGDELLGNLTIGLGDDGRPFITYYHGAVRQHGGSDAGHNDEQ